MERWLLAARCDSKQLVAVASAMVRKMFRPGIRYWKAGVMLLDIAEKSVHQGCLFDCEPEAHGRSDRLLSVLDQACAKWGRGALGLGAAVLAGNRPWSLQRSNLSPAYTTRWSDLPTLRA